MFIEEPEEYDDSDPANEPKSPRNYEVGCETRKASIVLFGVFQVQEISMPTIVDHTTNDLLIARPHPTLKGTAAEAIAKSYYVEKILSSLQYQYS
jgi:hypothetical protein